MFGYIVLVVKVLVTLVIAALVLGLGVFVHTSLAGFVVPLSTLHTAGIWTAYFFTVVLALNSAYSLWAPYD